MSASPAGTCRELRRAGLRTFRMNNVFEGFAIGAASCSGEVCILYTLTPRKQRLREQAHLHFSSRFRSIPSTCSDGPYALPATAPALRDWTWRGRIASTWTTATVASTPNLQPSLEMSEELAHVSSTSLATSTEVRFAYSGFIMKLWEPITHSLLCAVPDLSLGD